MPRRNDRRTHRVRSVEGLARQIAEIQENTGTSHNSRRIDIRRPTNSADVAAAAIASLDRGNTPVKIKEFAKGVMSVWARVSTAETAGTFWRDPNHIILSFFRDSYLGGLGTLAYASLVDLYGVRPNPSKKVGELYSLDRKQAAVLSLERLTAAAGDVAILGALDQPVPEYLRIVTVSEDVWRDEISRSEFPTRLASYEANTLQEFANTLRTYQQITSRTRTYIPR